MNYPVDSFLLVLLALNIQLEIDWKSKKISFCFGRGKQKNN